LRSAQADVGIEALRAEVDTLIVIPNDRLLAISDRTITLADAFKSADQVLLSGVQGITEIITQPGLINLDFADVKAVMSGAGSALMGIGSARGENRAIRAAELAISSHYSKHQLMVLWEFSFLYLVDQILVYSKLMKRANLFSLLCIQTQSSSLEQLSMMH
jgi:cell division GTPase FtsZ